MYKGVLFYSYYPNDDTLVATPYVGFDYKFLLSEVFVLRHDTHLKNIDVPYAGKILRFQIDITTYDGAPCSVNGFVDESDIPPIDTWFCVTTTYLYCWIPSMFLQAMQDVIDVECLYSYEWLENIDEALIEI